MAPFELQAALSGMVCDKMARAWRNRSNVTRNRWYLAAERLAGVTTPAIHQLAAALYVACGELGECFDGQTITPTGWENLASRVAKVIAEQPEKMSNRGQFEQRDTRSAEDVCRMLYDVLQLWRTGRAMSRADIWRVTREAEEAYLKHFSI